MGKGGLGDVGTPDELVAVDGEWKVKLDGSPLGASTSN